MRHLIITALLAVTLFAAIPVARAADWSNDHFSCDVEVLKVGGELLDIHLWGVWTKMIVKIYITPGLIGIKYPSADYVCVTDHNNYFCHHYRNVFSHFTGARVNLYSVIINPGVSKRDVCEIMYNKSNITWQEGVYKEKQ